MAERQHDPQADDQIKQLIRTKARRYSRNSALREWLREDLEQELAVVWIEAGPRFDPEWGDILTYADHVFNNHLQNLIKAQRAGKRDYRRCQRSLDDPVDAAWESDQTLGDVYDQDRYIAATGGRTSRFDALVGLQNDLRSVLASLPPQLRHFAAVLGEAKDLTEAADRAGISRPTAYKWRAEIAGAFRAAGLDAYLPGLNRMHKKVRPSGLHISRKSCSDRQREEL